MSTCSANAIAFMAFVGPPLCAIAFVIGIAVTVGWRDGSLTRAHWRRRREVNRRVSSYLALGLTEYRASELVEAEMQREALEMIRAQERAMAEVSA